MEQNLKEYRITHDDYFTQSFQRKRLGKAFLFEVLPKKLSDELDLENLTVESRHLTDNTFKTTIADVVYRVPIKNSTQHVDFFAVLEHKSFHDPKTMFQLWGYVYKTSRKHGKGGLLPPVIPIIVYHGRSKYAGSTELSDSFYQIKGAEPYLPKMRAILYDLNAMDAIPENSSVPELKIVLTVMKTVFSKDVGMKLRELLETMKPYSEAPEMRQVIRLTWVYLAYSARYIKKNYNVLEETIQNAMGDEKMPTMVQIWLKQGRAEGRAVGRVEAIIRVLKSRHRGESLSGWATKRLYEIGDDVVLDSLTELAAVCESVDEFEKNL